jgi:hypothetical protein
MNAYKFKHQYRATKRVSSIFKTTFFLTALGLLLVVGATIFSPEATYTFGGNTLSARLLFGLFFLTCVVLLAAYIGLWVGMLHFLIKYDGRSPSRKAPWFLICFFGLSYGAALYYWFVYRKFLAAGAPLTS